MLPGYKINFVIHRNDLIFLGLKVLGTVSDMINTNMAAVDILSLSLCQPKKPGRILVYKIRGQKIIHCCDGPHLIKVVRNNFQTKDLVHHLPDDWRQINFATVDLSSVEINQRLRLASWDDVSSFYEQNKLVAVSPIPNIVDEHIYTNAMKMKVSYATQVLSQTFGNAMLSYSEEKNLALSSTAQVLLFFNDVFDSINGHGVGTNLKSAVTTNSIHIKFWDYALVMLSKMQFVDKDTGKANNRSNILHNFRSTIEGYKELSRLDIYFTKKLFDRTTIM